MVRLTLGGPSRPWVLTRVLGEERPRSSRLLPLGQHVSSARPVLPPGYLDGGVERKPEIHRRKRDPKGELQDR